jgi:Ni/Co efflux regulator RcnB
MKKRMVTVILAGALAAAMALPLTATTVSAGRGGAKGQSLQTHTRSRSHMWNRERLRDGSCLDPAKEGTGRMQKKGKTYGPGDGTGNMGVRPEDGTGYGAPSQR